ncbi:unnamed protein product [Aphanomyces euteiches]
MDWGLGRPQYNFLGDGHMYSRRWIYYCKEFHPMTCHFFTCVVAIVADLILIFSWSLALIPPMDNDAFTFMGLLLYVQPFTMFLEPIRRSMWSCFAMENEHLRNTLGFRKESFIPLHFERKREKIDLNDTAHYAYKVAALAAAVLILCFVAVFLI